MNIVTTPTFVFTTHFHLFFKAFCHSPSDYVPQTRVTDKEEPLSFIVHEYLTLLLLLAQTQHKNTRTTDGCQCEVWLLIKLFQLTPDSHPQFNGLLIPIPSDSSLRRTFQLPVKTSNGPLTRGREGEEEEEMVSQSVERFDFRFTYFSIDVPSCPPLRLVIGRQTVELRPLTVEHFSAPPWTMKVVKRNKRLLDWDLNYRVINARDSVDRREKKNGIEVFSFFSFHLSEGNQFTNRPRATDFAL